MKVEHIKTELTYPLRHLVLRQGYPIETCYFQGDDLKDTFHFALFIQNEIRCILSYYQAEHPSLKKTNSFQLRGMATHPDWQGKGLGREIIIQTLPMMKEKGAEFIWCNARVSAQGFYQKLSFQTFGEIFDIPTVGPHLVMYRSITL